MPPEECPCHFMWQVNKFAVASRNCVVSGRSYMSAMADLLFDGELPHLPHKAAGGGHFGPAVLTTELCFLPGEPAGEPSTKPSGLPQRQAIASQPRSVILCHAKQILRSARHWNESSGGDEQARNGIS